MFFLLFYLLVALLPLAKSSFFLCFEYIWMTIIFPGERSEHKQAGTIIIITISVSIIIFFIEFCRKLPSQWEWWRLGGAGQWCACFSRLPASQPTSQPVIMQWEMPFQSEVNWLNDEMVVFSVEAWRVGGRVMQVVEEGKKGRRNVLSMLTYSLIGI